MKTFEQNKNAKELGIDTTRKFVVLDANATHSSRVKDGDIVSLDRDDGSACPYFKNETTGEKHVCMSWGGLAYLEKTLENLEPGDVVVDKDGDKRMVIDTSKNGKVYLLSAYWSEHHTPDQINSSQKCFSRAHTAHDLEQNAYTLFTEPTPPEVQEMTVGEIEKALGKKIKVVKSSDEV